MFDMFRRATKADFDETWQLYTDVCGQMPNDAYGPHWQLGIFPAEEDVKGYLERGQLYLGFIEGRLVAAMALTSCDDEQYADMVWPSGVHGDDASVIHLLAIHPSMRGMHLGSALVQEAIRLAREMGKKAIHLDVYPGNLAASRIYLSEGFSYVGMYESYYEDTGTMAFEMYEYVL